MGKVTALDELKISIQEKIKQSVEESLLIDLGIDTSTTELIYNFYEANGFNPKWINDSTLTEEGKKLKIILSNTVQFGIPIARYSDIKWYKTNFLQDEILITVTLAYLGNDLQNGFLEKDILALKPLHPVSLKRLEEITHFKENTTSSYERQKQKPA